MNKFTITILFFVFFNVGAAFLSKNLDASIALVFSVDLLIAIYIVHYAQRISDSAIKEKERTANQQDFANFVAAALTECAVNKNTAKTLKENLSEDTFNFNKFDYSVTQGMLLIEKFHRLLSDIHLISFHLYKTQSDLINRRLDFIYTNFVQKRIAISKKNIADINTEIIKLEKVILIIERDLEIFKIIYPRSKRLFDSKTMELLKKKGEMKLDQLQDELQQVIKMSPEEREKLKKHSHKISAG